MIKRKTFGIKRGAFKRDLSPEKLKSKRKAKRGKKKALWAEYGLTVPEYIRYTGRKGIYWHVFSKFIRQRDYTEHNGLCMTCEKFVEKGQGQCGHLFPARDCGFGLLFHPMNNHLQHSKCNNPRFTPSAGVHNTLNITKRYGVGTVETLAALKQIKTKEWSQKEYDSQIRLLLQKIEELKQTI